MSDKPPGEAYDYNPHECPDCHTVSPKMMAHAVRCSRLINNRNSAGSAGSVGMFDSESFSPAYVRCLLEENLRLAQANEAMRVELDTSKAMLIAYGYEENELPFMLEEFIAIGHQQDAFVIRVNAESEQLRAQITSLEAAAALLQGQHGQTCAPPCNPEWDATDAGCSCWWRGDDHGARKVAEIVLNWRVGDIHGLRQAMERILKPAPEATIPIAGAESPCERSEAEKTPDRVLGSDSPILESIFKSDGQPDPDTSDEDGGMKEWW